MVLGGSPLNSTIEVAIYQFALFELNFNKAIFLSFIQIFICSIFIFIGFNKMKGSKYFEINNTIYTHPYKNYKFIKCDIANKKFKDVKNRLIKIVLK